MSSNFFCFFSNLLLRTSIEFNREHKKFPPSLWKFEGFLVFFFLFNVSWKGRENPAGDFLPWAGKTRGEDQPG